jgi:hypothetical protein
MKKITAISFFISLGSFAFSQTSFSPMVRETSFPPVVDTYTVNDNCNIILSDYHEEEILVVLEDIMGNDVYSKVVFKNQCAVLKAADPYNRIPSGVYTVIASSRNEIYNQKIVVD